MDTGAWVDRRARGLYEMTTGDSGWDLSPAHIMRYYGYVHNYQGEGQANWVKGWNGETFLTDMSNNEVLVRVRIDQDLKREMGY